MVRGIAGVAAVMALVAPVATAGAETMGFNLVLRVPVHCTVRHQPVAGVGSAETGAVALGELREYCNAPTGYQLIVSYAPGALRGAVIQAGEDRVVLNGSGEAVISQSPRPRFRARMITAMPGENGFDTDRLQFHLRAT